MLHRDLKPSNVMLNASGQILVTDFGIAGMAEQLKGADVTSGAPTYMAPEQLEGSEVPARSDICALGLLLYEIFTGKRAFASGERRELISPSSLAKDLDPATDRIISRCPAEAPAGRPATAFSVARALPGGDPLEAALAVGDFLWRAPAGLDFSAWYQNGGQVVALIVVLLSGYSFHSALASRRLIIGKLLGA